MVLTILNLRIFLNIKEANTPNDAKYPIISTTVNSIFILINLINQKLGGIILILNCYHNQNLDNSTKKYHYKTVTVFYVF